MNNAARIAALVKSSGMSPVAAATFVKAAADAAGIRARMEKRAISYNPFRALGRMFSGAPAAAAGAASAPARSPMLTGRRALTGLAGLGGAGVLGGHMHNAAQNTAATGDDPGGVTLNPFTWHRGRPGRYLGLSNGGPSREEIFKRNQEGFNEASGDIRAQMDAALAAGDHPRFNALNEKFQKNDFEPDYGWGIDSILEGKTPRLNARMFGLNPFAARSADTYAGNMAAQQGALQGGYNAAMGKVGPQPGDAEMVKQLTERLNSPDLLPHQHAAMQKQLESLNARMKMTPGQESPEATAIKDRMGKAGMRFTPWKPPGAPAPTPAASTGNYHLGSRPYLPGRAQGFAFNPGDYANVPEPNYLGPSYNRPAG